MTAAFSNRVTELLGVDIPIVQAPMGWIARAQLASAVSNAGGLGIIETSSGELDEVREEIRKMRDLTDKPFGVNIAQAFVRDPDIVDFVVEQGVKFVTTSAGDPTKYTDAAEGRRAHRLPRGARRWPAALKAIDAGVDGLVVEGGEGGGFKNPRDVATMVLLPLVVLEGRRAGDRRRRHRATAATMAAAFALGAEGVQMGTRMVSAAESPGARELEGRDRRRHGDRHRLPEPLHTGPALRALRTERTDAARATREHEHHGASSATRMDLYFGGDMEAVDRARRPGRRPHRRGEAGRRRSSRSAHATASPRSSDLADALPGPT